ncbi:hypothetical protein Anas_14688, partial [Armadillidium nasatum]
FIRSAKPLQSLCELTKDCFTRGRSLELKKFSFLYGYNRILYVNDIPAITAILESFPVHDCTLSF